MKVLYLGKGLFVFHCPGCEDLHFIPTSKLTVGYLFILDYDRPQ